MGVPVAMMEGGAGRCVEALAGQTHGVILCAMNTCGLSILYLKCLAPEVLQILDF